MNEPTLLGFDDSKEFTIGYGIPDRSTRSNSGIAKQLPLNPVNLRQLKALIDEPL
jgi:hypothetical protein